MAVKLQEPGRAAPLFAGWQETIIWSCLQGVMGEIYGDSLENPVSAAAFLGDFLFLAGEPEESLVRLRLEGGTPDFILMIGQNEDWKRMIKACWGEKAVLRTRYAFKKDPKGFDEKRLREMARRIPEGYTMERIGSGLFEQCRSREWSRDLVSQFPEYESYQRFGLGVAVLKNGELVSGASSYSSYHGGIEVEIDTKEEYRRQGLACACGAGLILECRRRNWYPSWDAHNLWSKALAEKLGYQFDYAYDAYEIRGY
ncbi:MAG: GNAT family N-acetyltransferase [Lachnospiraceae bacterium]|nr:GNAT family N-acetyltransferase [Lachnospiraceae bacterium]